MKVRKDWTGYKWYAIFYDGVHNLLLLGYSGSHALKRAKQKYSRYFGNLVYVEELE